MLCIWLSFILGSLLPAFFYGLKYSETANYSYLTANRWGVVAMAVFLVIDMVLLSVFSVFRDVIGHIISSF